MPVLAFFVGLSLLAVTASVAFHLVTTRTAESLTSKVASALARITRTKVSMESNTITVDQADIAELALVSRRIQTIVKYASEFFGSDNVLILRGEFEIKAGFDLSKPFSVNVDETTGTITSDFPPAEILGVEMLKYDVFHAEDGIWNKLSVATHESVTRQLLMQARLDAARSDITREAEARLSTRLRDLLQLSSRSSGPPPVVSLGNTDAAPQAPLP